MSDKCGNGEKDEYGVYLIPNEDLNVALATEGATMVKNGMSQAALDGNFDNCDEHTAHSIHNEEDDPGIIIKLRHPFLLNRLRFRLWDKEERCYSYYVDISIDNMEWIRICDHTKYNCRSWQYIVFPRMLVRYIRIVGTFNTGNQWFHVVFVKAYLSMKEAILDRKWEPILGIFAPSTNVATPEWGARVIEGTSPEFLLNGETTGHTRYTQHIIGSGVICIQLSQPFIISSMSLRLWDGDARKYSYVIHVSTDRSNWTMICNRTMQTSWQTVDFPEPLPVVYVRIMGTHNTANEFFHCVHFECPSSKSSTVKAIGPSE